MPLHIFFFLKLTNRWKQFQFLMTYFSSSKSISFILEAKFYFALSPLCWLLIWFFTELNITCITFNAYILWPVVRNSKLRSNGIPFFFIKIFLLHLIFQIFIDFLYIFQSFFYFTIVFVSSMIFSTLILFSFWSTQTSSINALTSFPCFSLIELSYIRFWSFNSFAPFGSKPIDSLLICSSLIILSLISF